MFVTRSFLRSSVMPMAATTMLLAIGSCGGGDEPATPDAADIPAGAVALVGDEPVTKRQLRERLAALRRGQRDETEQSVRQLRQQALALLLQETALEQEAADLDVVVPEAQVRKRVGQARRQFKSERQFRRFLGGQTEADLVAQLRMQSLAERVAEESDGEGSGSRSLEVLRRQWREQTVCRAGYLVSGCSNSKSAAS
jgi:hypothetical protein